MIANLFLIGAMKSGTTTLHELLADHPEIAMCNPKEPCYFIQPSVLKTIWPEMWELGFWRSEAAYSAIFPDKPQAKYFGESSTDYSKNPKVSGVAERIKTYNADARFIYILRDPVERTVSHYWHMVEHRAERRSPLEAILQDPHYTEVSHYAMQLEPYLQHFDAQRIKVITFEALKANPTSVLKDLYGWLGVSQTHLTTTPDAAHNVTSAVVRQQRSYTGFLKRIRYSNTWNLIGPHVPKFIRQMGVNQIERRIDRRTVDMTEVINHLRPLQRTQTASLAALTGHDFPEWTTLYGD